MSVEFSAYYDEGERKIVVRIEIPDGQLARRHLVPIDLTRPQEAIAGYVLHCLKVLDDLRREDAARRLRMHGIPVEDRP